MTGRASTRALPGARKPDPGGKRIGEQTNPPITFACAAHLQDGILVHASAGGLSAMAMILRSLVIQPRFARLTALHTPVADPADTGAAAVAARRTSQGGRPCASLE